MIIESLVSTLNVDGSVNIAPMGLHIDGGWVRFELRPFEATTTCSNLKRTRQGIVHITDDVELIARAAISGLTELPELVPGRKVQVPAIGNACRWYEFQVESIIELSPRVQLLCRTLYEHRNRDFIGFNRAKHAVLEAAILATRLDFIPMEEIVEQFRRLATIVEKTGGAQEQAGFMLLQRLLQEAQAKSKRIR
jgi:hypothetical protein